jgi:hypothetical protein
MREVVAKHIIEIAKQGGRDPQSLAEDTVSFVAANYRNAKPVTSMAAAAPSLEAARQ